MPSTGPTLPVTVRTPFSEWNFIKSFLCCGIPSSSELPLPFERELLMDFARGFGEIKDKEEAVLGRKR